MARRVLPGDLSPGPPSTFPGYRPPHEPGKGSWAHNTSGPPPPGTWASPCSAARWSPGSAGGGSEASGGARRRWRRLREAWWRGRGSVCPISPQTWTRMRAPSPPHLRRLRAPGVPGPLGVAGGDAPHFGSAVSLFSCFPFQWHPPWDTEVVELREGPRGWGAGIHDGGRHRSGGNPLAGAPGSLPSPWFGRPDAECVVSLRAPALRGLERGAGRDRVRVRVPPAEIGPALASGPGASRGAEQRRDCSSARGLGLLPGKRRSPGPTVDSSLGTERRGPRLQKEDAQSGKSPREAWPRLRELCRQPHNT